MLDVAKMAGVGTMTVSRVLNGTARVSGSTRTRVLNAIASLNYSPNEIARSLRDQRTRQLGVIVPNLHDPFFAICAHAISQVARQRLYSVIIATSNEDTEAEYVEASRMLRRHIEGIVLIPALGKSRLNSDEFQETPMVTLDRPISGSSFDGVLVENKVGARQGVQHLIEHGHTSIAYLGLRRAPYTIRARLEGYRAAMAEAGCVPKTRFVDESKTQAVSVLDELLSCAIRPTALFCSNNLTTRNALHALSMLNVAIPDELALVGFDDFEMADIVKPSITVVRQMPDTMGRLAAELLFSRLDHDPLAKGKRRTVLPTELIVRESCGTHASAGLPLRIDGQTPSRKRGAAGLDSHRPAGVAERQGFSLAITTSS